MDTEDMKSPIIKTDADHILRNKVSDSRLQGHFNIKNELLFTTDNCNNGINTEMEAQIDPQMLTNPIKNEPRCDGHAKLQPCHDNQNRKLPVKQEVSDKIVDPNTPKIFGSQFSLQPNSPRNIGIEHEVKPYVPYCDIPIKLEVNNSNSVNVDIKSESMDINDDGEMIQMENGCTNSGCSSQTRCLHTYKCSKCNLVFTEKQTFATHLKKCRLNKNPATVPLNANATPHKTYECEHSNHNLKKLIESVRTNPSLYDMSNEDYDDTELKDVIWANIACSCGFSSGALAKAAWKKLKENFREALTQQNNPLSHQPVMHSKVFKYQKHMEFLLPYMGSSMPNEENPIDSAMIPDMSCTEEIEDDISVIQQMVSPAKKQKLMPNNETGNIVNSNKRHRDGRKKSFNNLKEANVRSSTSTQPLHMFFLSMCETTKNLPPPLQLQVKRRVFQAVIEAEEAAATLNNEPISNSTPHTSTSSSREDQYAMAQFSLDSLTNVIDNSSSSSQED